MSTILVVEDESTIREVIAAYLTRAGHKVIEAADGKQGLELFQTQKIDLVVLDLNLPEIDGITVCKSIREKSQVPIIMVTARIEEIEDVAEVEAVLDGLVIRELAVRLPRQPGQKEARYAHLLAGEVQVSEEVPVEPRRSRSADADRIAVLEETVEVLKRELADLRAQVVAFRAQFE